MKLGSYGYGAPVPGEQLFALGIQGAILMVSGGGQPFDMLNNLKGTISGSATKPTWKGRADHAGVGRPLFYTNSGSLTSYVSFATPPRWQDLSLTPGTIIARLRCQGNGGLPIGIAERNDGNTVNAGWALGVNSAQKLYFLQERASANKSRTAGTAMVTGQWHTVAASWGTSNTATDISLWQDGRDATPSGSSSNGSGVTGTDAANNLRIGSVDINSGSASKGCWAGEMSYVCWFKKVLSQPEIALFNDDGFWQLCQPTLATRAWIQAAANPGGGAFVSEAILRQGLVNAGVVS